MDRAPSRETGTAEVPLLPTIMALFQSPFDAERAVSELSLNGFAPDDVSILVFETVKAKDPARDGLLAWLSRGGALGDTADRSDGVTALDGTGVGAVFGGLVGTALGSLSRGGPVIGMTGGMMLGGLVGYLIDRLVPERRRGLREVKELDGLILVRVAIREPERMAGVQRLLRENNAKQLADLPQTQAGAL